jgi:hypothetical protein
MSFNPAINFRGACANRALLRVLELYQTGYEMPAAAATGK